MVDLPDAVALWPEVVKGSVRCHWREDVHGEIYGLDKRKRRLADNRAQRKILDKMHRNS